MSNDFLPDRTRTYCRNSVGQAVREVGIMQGVRPENLTTFGSLVCAGNGSAVRHRSFPAKIYVFRFHFTVRKRDSALGE